MPNRRCGSEKLDRFALDANAGEPAREEALEAFVRVAREAPGNPSSLHRNGRRAQGALEDARERVGAALGAPAREIVFTSGATEANNIALFGAARARSRLTGAAVPLVASLAEHASVVGPLRRLQQDGHSLALAPLDAHARPAAPALLALVAERRAQLVALQWANNETGAVQPVEEFAAALPDDVHWHCDAVQGFGKLPPATALARADTLVLSGHKFGAPKGVGVLRRREDAPLDPLMAGGGHQGGVRPGTESPALATAFAVALELALAEQPEWSEQAARAAAELLAALVAAGVSFQANHPAEPGGRLPNTLNLTFAGVDGRALLVACDAEGLSVASGSACSSGAPEPSPILRALGLTKELAKSSLRLSFGRYPPPGLGARAGERLAATVLRVYQAGFH
ncbi:MAG TPA: aminotransferase class V-fold PLP-dependent enzyme [Planctomycetota bacterium]